MDDASLSQRDARDFEDPLPKQPSTYGRGSVSRVTSDFEGLLALAGVEILG